MLESMVLALVGPVPVHPVTSTAYVFNAVIFV